VYCVPLGRGRRKGTHCVRPGTSVGFDRNRNGKVEPEHVKTACSLDWEGDIPKSIGMATFPGEDFHPRVLVSCDRKGRPPGSFPLKWRPDPLPYSRGASRGSVLLFLVRPIGQRRE